VARTNLAVNFQIEQLTGDKRLNIRSDLTAGDLMTAIQKQFSLDGLYELKFGGRALDPALPLDEQGVSESARLQFANVEAKQSDTAERIARGQRYSLSVQKSRVYFRDDREGTEYDVTWQPCVIGRRDPRDPARNTLLAVDLEEAGDALSVSRHHACLLEEGGMFYVEGLNQRNPTYVNDVALRVGARRLLHAGDRVLVGKISLTFNIVD